MASCSPLGQDVPHAQVSRRHHASSADLVGRPLHTNARSPLGCTGASTWAMGCDSSNLHTRISWGATLKRHCRSPFSAKILVACHLHKEVVIQIIVQSGDSPSRSNPNIHRLKLPQAAVMRNQNVTPQLRNLEEQLMLRHVRDFGCRPLVKGSFRWLREATPENRVGRQ